IRLYAGKNITLTVPMETTTIKEEVVVTAKVGVVDTRRTSVGLNVTKEALQSLPSSRNPWSVISMAPGVMSDTADVGGSESGQQSHPNAGGSSYGDTGWSVDGIDTSDLAEVGTSTSYLDVNNFEELQITTGASDITAQTGGVQINFVSKRGGNRMSGDLHLYAEDKAWEQKQDAPESPPISDYVTPGINRLYQYGASVGGPIRKDRLWWFGAWSIQDIHARSMNGEEAAILLNHGYGKFNAQFGNTSAEFHLSYDNKLYDGRPRYSQAEQTRESLRDQTGPNYYWFGSLQHILGDLMLNAKIGFVNNAYYLDPRGSERDPVSGHEVGNERVRYARSFIRLSGSDTHFLTNRDQMNAQLEGNLFLENVLGGDHEIRFGVDYTTADTVSETIWPNQRTLYVKYYGDFTSSYGLWLTPDNKIDFFFNRLSGYLSDTFSLKRLTLNLGLRYDLQAARINRTELPGYTWVDTIDSAHDGLELFPEWLGPLTVQEFKVPSFKTWSPRLSLTYDIAGDGKNVVKLSAARYGSRVGNELAYDLMPIREVDVYWYDDGDGIPTYNELDSYYGFAYVYANYCTNIDYATGRVNARHDSNYSSPLLDELTLSFEKQLAEDLAVSLTGIYRKQHNLLRQVGIMADGSIETKANWYKAGTETVNGKAVDYWNRYEVPEGTYFTNYKKNYNRYTAVQLALTKKFSRRWMADASFIYQDWKRFLFEEETFNMTNFDYWNGAAFAPRSVRESSDVYLNSRWQFKLAGLYQLPWGLNLSLALTAQEGYVLANYADSSKKIKGASYFDVYEPDKKFGDDRLPAFWTLNLGLEKRFQLGAGDATTATVFVDAYNVTNNGTTLAKGAQFDTSSFGKITRKLNPGIFQFGFRLNF
ncbi:MAG: hypothetical protein JXO51_02435, partial [Candidatus Aminicenantes bacterium]|nr:hypothetical protein [Candidatus Aminicenantes bacterium]